MAKEVTKIIKLQIEAGKATPAPPVGTALGPAGVNIGEFVNQFNTQTRSMMGSIVPVLMTVYKDRSFTFIVKKPPASRLILKSMNMEKGSHKAQDKVGKLTGKQLGKNGRPQRQRPRARKENHCWYRSVHGD